jgi:hypothetical protein
VNITKYTAAAALVATTSLTGLAPVGTPFVGEAAAQYCPTVTSTPCLQAKQNANTRNYQIGYDNPYQCDDEIDTAASAWNAAGSRFRAYKDPISGTATPAGTTKYQVTSSRPRTLQHDGARRDATALGRQLLHRRAQHPGGGRCRHHGQFRQVGGGQLRLRAVATSGNKYDMAEIVAHEFGHLVGQNHVNVTTCVTYQYGSTT